MAEAQANIRHFVTEKKGSGRLAPTLVEDLTLYDPNLRHLPSQNLLNQEPVYFGERPYLRDYLPNGSCRHALYLQPRQTVSPQLDERPGQDSVYQVTAVCRICRIHVTLKVDYSIRWRESPCPNQARSVHHLVTSPRNQDLARARIKDANQSDEVYVYECSSPTCSAVVTVQLSPAVLSLQNIDLLTDPALLKARTDAAFAVEGADTQGMRHPKPIEVLIDLRAYIRNAWNPDAKSQINLDNKRFIVRFGPGGTACQQVLESLGFVLEPGKYWRVPTPISRDSKPLSNPHDISLDNLEYELNSLIVAQPTEDRQMAQDQTLLEDAKVEMSRALGCQSYDQDVSERTLRLLPANRSAAFVVLGCPESASDALVESAYDWQCASSPQYGPHYLSSLKQIALWRSNGDLALKEAVERSNGRVDAIQVRDAYDHFGLDMRRQPSEDYIIGTFKSRLQDSPAQEIELREYLRVIGTSMNSQKITDFARREVNTYDQAMEYLDVKPDSDDDYIQAMHGWKVADNVNGRNLADSAIKIIAMHRRSAALQHYIENGYRVSSTREMTLADANRIFSIESQDVPDDVIIPLYEMAIKEDASNAERYRAALLTIGRQRKSMAIMATLEMMTDDLGQGTSEQPVGLDNIGNTCYLNSLLQFLFTIQGVRSVVLDFDHYKMNPTPDNLSRKKVGERSVKIEEVETAQKFVAAMAVLFQSMITTPRNAVRPELELARLTLETPKAKEEIRRRSTIASAGMRPHLGSISGIPLQGPALPPAEEQKELKDQTSEHAIAESNDDEVMKENTISSHRLVNASTSTEDSDENSSEATLVSRRSSENQVIVDHTLIDQQRAILANKENLGPFKVGDVVEPPTTDAEPLRPASPSKLNSQAGALAGAANRSSSDHAGRESTQPVKYAPPPGPPPVPPRKPAQTATSTLEEYARQQDVNETLSHCLFQFSCAMRASSVDEAGRQKDEIRDLFFGAEQVHFVNEASAPSEVPFSSLYTNITNRPKDVYDALDNRFDVSDLGGGRLAYSSITKLAPILTIQFIRVIWDQKTNSQKKLDHHIEVLEEIFMDRYLEATADSSLMQRRQQAWRMKRELAMLEEQKAFLERERAGAKDLASLYEEATHVVQFLQSAGSGDDITIEPDTIELLTEMSTKAREHHEDLGRKITRLKQSLDGLFVDMREHRYVLHAIFFHRGGPTSGHYWIYIKDHKAGVWRKYNDDHVTTVYEPNSIFGRPNATGGYASPELPYVLAYVKAGDNPTLEELVEAVCRDPVPEEEPIRELDGIEFEALGADEYSNAPSQLTELPPGSAIDLDNVNWHEKPRLVGKQSDQWVYEEPDVPAETWYR